MKSNSTTLPKTTLTILKNILINDYKPLWEMRILARDMKNNLKKINLHHQLNLLSSLNSRSLSTIEIINQARKMNQQAKTNQRFKSDEAQILRKRIRMKKMEIKEHQIILRADYDRTWDIGLSQVAWDAYRFHKNLILFNAWNLGKESVRDKIEWIQKKTKQASNSSSNFYQNSPICNDIPTSDKDLSDRFGEIPVHPIILGDIVCSEYVKLFLILPSKIRIYNKIDKNKIEVEAETTSCKQRWSSQDAADIPISDRNDPEVIREHVKSICEQKDIDYLLRRPTKNKSVDFRNIRASELKHNSKMILPDPANNRDEIVIQNQKLIVMNDVERYLYSDNDSQNLSGSNLTKSELRGLKEIK